MQFFRDTSGEAISYPDLCCLSALSELGNKSSSNGLLLLGRLDKCVANDHVGVDGREELVTLMGVEGGLE